jgi:hypothetical protein
MQFTVVHGHPHHLWHIPQHLRMGLCLTAVKHTLHLGHGLHILYYRVSILVVWLKYFFFLDFVILFFLFLFISFVLYSFLLSLILFFKTS